MLPPYLLSSFISPYNRLYVVEFKHKAWHVSSIIQSGLTLTTDGILGPITPELPVEGLDLSDVPPAEEWGIKAFPLLLFQFVYKLIVIGYIT